MKAKECIEIFNSCIEMYHKTDNVDAKFINPFVENSIQNIIYLKSWIDTVQWHLEDIIREPSIDAIEGMLIKRRIDKSNQNRTDVVEKIDDYYINLFKDIILNDNAKLNTESPAWVIDRLSILCLKIYHMKEQTMRKDVNKNHIKQCSFKLSVLLEQQKDLSSSLDQFLHEISKGEKEIKVYRQMKMYNDSTLNPILYTNKK